MRTTRRIRRVALAIIGCLALAAQAADGDRDTTALGGFDNQLDYGFGISLHGSLAEVLRFKRWLDAIATVPKGVDTLWTISASGHRLDIRHFRHAVLSSGRTQAPMTANLTNGVGEDVTILFNAYIPEQGSHRVFDARDTAIEFTALQNLYHELAHAMHKMTGTWLYFRSEASAIDEENVFRRQLAEQQHHPFYKRSQLRGEAVCPTPRLGFAAWLGQELICDVAVSAR